MSMKMPVYEKDVDANVSPSEVRSADPVKRRKSPGYMKPRPNYFATSRRTARGSFPRSSPL